MFNLIKDKMLIYSLLCLGLFLIFGFSLPDRQKMNSIILIDPGHGGRDTGVAWTDSLTEKHISMQYAHTLAAELKTLHFSPRFTHQSVDSFLPLQKRLEMISTYRANVFITLHVNATTKDSNAIELFYNLNDSAGLRLGNSLKKELEKQHIKTLLTPYRFFLIKFSPLPAVMVSLRAGKTEKGAQHLLDEQFRKQTCQALARGIKNFLKINKKLNSGMKNEN